jgi:predicted DNA-binding transcriptional regulator AlpA
MPESVRQFLRVREAAAFVGLSSATLNKLRCVGGGPVFHKAGRAVIYDRDDLTAWLRALKKRSSTSN